MTGVKVKLSKAQVATLRKFKEHRDVFPDYADRGWLNIHNLNRGSVRALWNKGMVESRMVPRDSSVFRITQRGIDVLAEIGEPEETKGDNGKKIVYVADRYSDNITIRSAVIEKETDKQYQVAYQHVDSKNVFGVDYMYIGKRLDKGKHHVFDTLQEAYQWGLNAMEDHADQLYARIAKTQEIASNLKHLLLNYSEEDK